MPLGANLQGAAPLPFPTAASCPLQRSKATQSGGLALLQGALFLRQSEELQVPLAAVQSSSQGATLWHWLRGGRCCFQDVIVVT